MKILKFIEWEEWDKNEIEFKFLSIQSNEAVFTVITNEMSACIVIL